jgi:hypothetical protein
MKHSMLSEGLLGWLVEAIFLFAGLILWWLIIVLAGMFTLLVVLVWLPDLLSSKLWAKYKPQRLRNSFKVELSH